MYGFYNQKIISYLHVSSNFDIDLIILVFSHIRVDILPLMQNFDMTIYHMTERIIHYSPLAHTFIFIFTLQKYVFFSSPVDSNVHHHHL